MRESEGESDVDEEGKVDENEGNGKWKGVGEKGDREVEWRGREEDVE